MYSHNNSQKFHYGDRPNVGQVWKNEPIKQKTACLHCRFGKRNGKRPVHNPATAYPKFH